VDPKPIAVSVVVPAYNAEATIGRTLAALAAQELDKRFEVIVVDGGSTDGTLAVLADPADWVTVLHNPERDPASSRNLGARNATTSKLAFTDADCEPAPGWLSAGLEALKDADIIQGKVLPRESHGPFDRTLGVVGEYGLYETANLFVRRDTFDLADGFEPIPGLQLPDGTHFGEDAWFVWRAKRLGARTAFSEEALVRHAVFFRGGRRFLADVGRRRHFPQLVALIPELRGAYLYHRWFLSPISLRFDLAMTGVALAVFRRRLAPLVAALPYAFAVGSQVGRHPARQRARVLAGLLAADALTMASLVCGSLGARTLVL
jgi:glycosyltransferase involved in cell wall biosynthesis